MNICDLVLTTTEFHLWCVFSMSHFLEGYWEYAEQSSLLKGLRCILFNRQMDVSKWFEGLNFNNPSFYNNFKHPWEHGWGSFQDRYKRWSIQEIGRFCTMDGILGHVIYNFIYIALPDIFCMCFSRVYIVQTPKPLLFIY